MQRIFFFVGLFIVFGALFGGCRSEHVLKTCHIQLLDAPPEVEIYLQQHLYKPDYFVELDHTGAIVPRPLEGDKAIEPHTPFVFFRSYQQAETRIDKGTDNYRYDIKFLYDAESFLQQINIHIERYEHNYWHGYSNPGIISLRLSAKESKMKPKQQQHVILEKIMAAIKKVAFK